jgi:hypothetical protein
MTLQRRFQAIGAAVLLSGVPVAAQEPPSKAKVDCAALQQDLFIDLKVVVEAGCTPSDAQIAKLLDNPVGNFVSLPLQYDYVTLDGPRFPGAQTMHRLQLTPTFPLSLGKNWNLINRVVIPALQVPINEKFGDCIGLGPGSIGSCPGFPDAIADPFDATTGLSDIVYLGLASPKSPIKFESTGGAMIWGVGATAMFPTASDEVLGTGKYALGPSAVVAYLGPKWTLGVFPQQWWSIAGDGTRRDVNLTNIQYFVFYAPPWGDEAQWRIGMSPNVSIDWQASGDKLTFPVGLGLGRMISLGQLPVHVHLEVDYSVIHPGDGPGSRWDVRLYFVPVIPTFVF